MNISYQGIGQETLTMRCNSQLAEGMLCYPALEDILAYCVSDDEFFGVVQKVRNGLATVVYRGFVTVPYNGTAPSVGWTALTAHDQNSVKASADGVCHWVTTVDELAKTVTFLL